MTFLLLAAVAAASLQTGAPNTFGKTFVGRLAGKIEVRMQLERAGDRLHGRYSYVRVAESLLGLKGTIGADGAFVLDEFDSGRRTGGFRGRLVREEAKGVTLLKLAGTWSSADGRRTLPFELVEEHLEVNGEPIVYSTSGIQDEDAKRGYAITATYPKFEGPRPVVAKLNAEIERLVTTRVAEFRKLAEEWTRERRAEGLKADPSDLGMDYEAFAVGDGLLSLRFSTFTYFVGAAHPSHDSEVFNYDVRTSRRLELGDLFAPRANYLKVLADYCIAKLAPPDGSIAAGAAPTPENYALWNIMPDGLRITFAEYQVGPYVAGQPEVTIPYKELAPILRKGGPLEPFLKRDSPTPR